MSENLILDFFYAMPELWYGLAAVLTALAALVAWLAVKILRLNQRSYFLNRDRERYAEMIYASGDGYFAFVYPDQKVNDPRGRITERCSRRLAVILGLEQGASASFDDVLAKFHKDDARRVRKYVDLLAGEGVSFADRFVLKAGGRHVALSGSRVCGVDGNVYCDIVWFRDISFEAETLNALRKGNDALSARLARLGDMLDNLDYPVWLRDENLRLAEVNRRYLDFVDEKDKAAAISKGREILATSGESVSRGLAASALSANKPRHKESAVTAAGRMLAVDVIETPFYAGDSLDKICTVGSMVDVSRYDVLRRSLKEQHNNHLEIMGMLGTAFALFGRDGKISFYNRAFRLLWELDEDWLESRPAYAELLDVVRPKRIFPEVPDFRKFKEEELKFFAEAIESREDLLHLPDGRSLRRLRAPHPLGGVVFAYEDISDSLAVRRAYNAASAVRCEILDAMFDALLVFGETGRLECHNRAYAALFGTAEEFLAASPSLREAIDAQGNLFADSAREKMLRHIASGAKKPLAFQTLDGRNLSLRAAKLSDGSLLLVYRNVS